MPLVYAGTRDEEPITEAHERARKVKPQYARGEPVKVAFAQNQAEAELIQGLLLEEGVPSFLKRSPGFDVPDFLAAGPREVLVPEAGAEAARELLQGTQLLGETRSEGEIKAEASSPGSGRSPALALLFWVLLAAVVAFGVIWALDALTS